MIRLGLVAVLLVFFVRGYLAADNTLCIAQLDHVAHSCNFRDFFNRVDQCELNTAQLSKRLQQVLDPQHQWTINRLQKEIESLSVRITGATEYSGLVEVYANGHWGAVCNDNTWTRADANVFCRMIGFNTSATTQPGEGATGLPYVLANVRCHGNEASIFDCPLHKVAPDAQSPCVANKAAQVTCDIGVRLADGSDPYRGRVEISHLGQWGTICDDNWSDQDATVVCRMLGFHNVNAKAYAGSVYGDGHGLIQLSDVICTGRENSLLDCQHSGFGQRSMTCSHQRDASVLCEQI